LPKASQGGPAVHSSGLLVPALFFLTKLWIYSLEIFIEPVKGLVTEIDDIIFMEILETQLTSAYIVKSNLSGAKPLRGVA
jgi:hypothetical protein